MDQISYRPLACMFSVVTFMYKAQVLKAHHCVLINYVAITSYARMKFVNVVIFYSTN